MGEYLDSLGGGEIARERAADLAKARRRLVTASDAAADQAWFIAPTGTRHLVRTAERFGDRFSEWTAFTAKCDRWVTGNTVVRQQESKVCRRCYPPEGGLR